MGLDGFATRFALVPTTLSVQTELGPVTSADLYGLGGWFKLRVIQPLLGRIARLLLKGLQRAQV